METDINPGTVSGEFPVEQPGSQLLMDVTSKRLRDTKSTESRSR